MIDTQLLVKIIKQQLKANGLTYKEVAQAFDLSEQSIKRVINAGNYNLKQLEALCNLLGISIVELFSQVESAIPKLKQLTLEQESILVADKKLLLIALCAFNQWTIQDMMQHYQFTEPECIHFLLKLHHMKLIELQTNNKIRLLVDRHFEWLENGPIWQFLLAEGLQDFLQKNPKKPQEQLIFTFGMLKPEAIVKMHLEMQKLRIAMAALHRESLDTPKNDCYGMSLLVSLKNWEPRSTKVLRK